MPDVLLETLAGRPTDGCWEIRTRLAGGEPRFLDVSVSGRGMLHRVVTRVYVDAGDVPAFVPEARRGTLIAAPDGEDGYRFDIRLQGEGETVFFAL